MPDRKTSGRTAVDVVADPYAGESAWMAVCLAAGDKSLAQAHENQQTSLVKKAVVDTAKTTSVGLIAANAMMTMFCVIYTADHISWLMTAAGTSWFMEQTMLPQRAGVTALVFGIIGFWQYFGFKRQNWLAKAGSCSLIAFLLFSMVTMGLPGLPVLAGILAYVAMSKLGGVMRKALPSTFNVNMALMAGGLASVPMGVIVITSIVQSFMSTTPSGAYSAPTIAQLLVTQLVLGVGVALPAAAVAQSSKSESIGACTGLNFALHSPMLFAFAIMGVIAAALGGASVINPAATNAVVVALGVAPLTASLTGAIPSLTAAFTVGLASFAAWTTVGSAAGALTNRVHQKRKNIDLIA